MAEKPQIYGIISEFNPFHLGHEYLIQQARKNGASHIVCIMSGNYVQRGEPAFFSKWARSEMALKCGADLIIELPLPWAISGAEKFAFGGVYLLNALSCVDKIIFGSECGDIRLLENTARLLLSTEWTAQLQKELKKGFSFANARQRAITAFYHTDISQLLNAPNNILGIEYCKAIKLLRSSIVPLAIKRKGAGHDTDNFPIEKIASSSQIRHLIQQNALKETADFLPEQAAQIVKREISHGLAPVFFKKLEPAILAKLRQMTAIDFSLLPDIGSEGLHNRLYHAVQNAVSLSDLYELTKTKRYSHARIRRLVLSAFLNLEEVSKISSPPYLKILGMNQAGSEILKICKQNNCQLPILVRSSDLPFLDENGQKIARLESTSTDLYALAQPQIQPCGTEWSRKFLYL